jgi:hypothetical protein
VTTDTTVKSALEKERYSTSGSRIDSSKINERTINKPIANNQYEYRRSLVQYVKQEKVIDRQS